jgi:prevent-host-death family protein
LEVIVEMDGSMITVGAFEAKTHLSSLLDKVAAGEEVLITKHGKAIARLVRAEDAAREDVDAVIAKMKALRAGTTLASDWKALRNEGRR